MVNVLGQIQFRLILINYIKSLYFIIYSVNNLIVAEVSKHICGKVLHESQPIREEKGSHNVRYMNKRRQLKQCKQSNLQAGCVMTVCSAVCTCGRRVFADDQWKQPDFSSYLM